MKKHINDQLHHGVSQLGYLSVLSLDGEFDSVIQLLQGQLTSNCLALNNANGQLSALCDEKGFVLCNFEILNHESMLLIVIDEMQVAIFCEQMEKLLPFFKVTISHTDYKIEGLALNKNESLLPGEHMLISSQDVRLSMRIQSKKGDTSGIASISHEQWSINRKVLNDHVIDAKDSGKYRPHELNQDKTRVSFEKGCYRGQEIIARMEYLGKQKKKTSLIVHEEQSEIESHPLIGQTIPWLGLLYSSCLLKVSN